jgi:hypothetical protein
MAIDSVTDQFQQNCGKVIIGDAPADDRVVLYIIKGRTNDQT